MSKELVSEMVLIPLVTQNDKTEELVERIEVDVSHLVTEDDEVEELTEKIEVDVSHLVTEDETPVDNLPSEKNQRLLTSSLYSGWKAPGEAKFLATANVSIFNSVKENPIVPDVFVSLDVEIDDDWWKKEHRSYFVWQFGKVPDLVIEIVSNKEGGEKGRKVNRYAKMRIPFYIIYDPMKHIMSEKLSVYHLRDNAYYLYSYESEDLLPNLRVTLWEGEFEGKHDTWLRWTDSQGNLILTGDELAQQERQEKEQERQEKELALQKVREETQAKEKALQKAERLAAKLKELGIDPEDL